jgi:hypothetical protein
MTVTEALAELSRLEENPPDGGTEYIDALEALRDAVRAERDDTPDETEVTRLVTLAGHPRHQMRDFTVTVRRAGQKPGRLHVRAQAEHDAILRAGMALARRHPDTDMTQWIVTGVEDPAPAPATWTPPAVHEHRYQGQTLRHSHEDIGSHGYFEHPEDGGRS